MAKGRKRSVRIVRQRRARTLEQRAVSHAWDVLRTRLQVGEIVVGEVVKLDHEYPGRGCRLNPVMHEKRWTVTLEPNLLLARTVFALKGPPSSCCGGQMLTGARACTIPNGGPSMICRNIPSIEQPWGRRYLSTKSQGVSLFASQSFER